MIDSKRSECLYTNVRAYVCMPACARTQGSNITLATPEVSSKSCTCSYVCTQSHHLSVIQPSPAALPHVRQPIRQLSYQSTDPHVYLLIFQPACLQACTVARPHALTWACSMRDRSHGSVTSDHGFWIFRLLSFCTSTYTCKCVRACVRVCVHTCMRACMRACVHACTCAWYTHEHARVRTHTSMHACMWRHNETKNSAC